MTGWRRCCEEIDGPVTTGPYQGRIDAVERAVVFQVAVCSRQHCIVLSYKQLLNISQHMFRAGTGHIVR
jgi:hypothetical protein